MKTRFILSFIVCGIVSGTMGQRAINLKFTAVNNESYIQLDSIKVMNRTQGGDTVLHWPDTTLMYEMSIGDTLLYIGYAMGFPVGVPSTINRGSIFQLFQSNPNPVRDQAVISMSLPSDGSVNVKIADIRGRVTMNIDQEFKSGLNSFIFHRGEEQIYILTARWNGITKSIKIITEGPVNRKACRLDYISSENGNPIFKKSLTKRALVVQESGILDSPITADKTYTFQLATNIPCPGTPTVTYEGQLYNTIQIFSQCWLKENLNVGSIISSNQNQINNGIKEKYCFNNNPDNCTIYGGIYQWNEMMQYTIQQGTQGICPPGWHLPTDEEWKVLEGAVDSYSGIGDNTWDDLGLRGTDAGTNLKTTYGWQYNHNGTDQFGFAGMPGGYRDIDGYTYGLTNLAYWWTSTKGDPSIGCGRRLDLDHTGVLRNLSYPRINGFSVRCLKD